MKVAVADRVASGVPIAAGQSAACDRCGATLRPNDRVEAVFHVDDGDVEVVARRCEHCSRGELRDRDAPCWLVRGMLLPSLDATGHSELVLSGASVVDRTE